MLEIIFTIILLIMGIIVSLILATALFSGLILGVAYMAGKLTAKAVVTARDSYYVSVSAYDSEIKAAQRQARKSHRPANKRKSSKK